MIAIAIFALTIGPWLLFAQDNKRESSHARRALGGTAFLGGLTGFVYLII